MISAAIAYVVVVVGCLGIIAWAAQDTHKLVRYTRTLERANRQWKGMLNKERSEK